MLRLVLTLFACALMFAQGASAQKYPDRPIRLVVPFGPGGSADAIARPLAERLGAALGQQVVIDNRPGGLTVIAADMVAKGAPDGYTLYLMPGTHVLTHLLVAKVPYDPIADFTPVALIGAQPYFVVANVEQPYKNFAEMISYAKANPEKISMGVSDAVTRVVATALEAAANVKFTIVPYKGGGPQNTDLLGNQIAAAIGTPNMMGFVDQGRLRAIVMSTPRRVPFLPQVPTVTESIPGSDFDVQTWYAIAGPAKMPEPVVRRLQEEVGKVMNQPEVRKKLDDLGVVTPADISSRATLTLMRDYQARMTKLVRAAGITPE